MTAIDLRASTMQILERFDKNDTPLEHFQRLWLCQYGGT